MTHRSCFMQVLPPPQRAAAVGEGEVGGCHRRRAVPCNHAADGGPRRPRRAVAHAQVPRGTYPTRFFFRSPVRTCLTRCCVHSNRIESNAMIRQTMQHVLRAGAEGGSPQTNPIIARIERNSGHCCGRSTQKIVCYLLHRALISRSLVEKTWEFATRSFELIESLRFVVVGGRSTRQRIDTRSRRRWWESLGSIDMSNPRGVKSAAVFSL